MLSHLTSALDDASPHQGRKIVAICILLFAFNAVVWTWAFVTLSAHPTAISAVVAMLIGGIEALGLIADKLELDGVFWDLISKINSGLAGFGYLVVAIFVASWIASYLIYRWRDFGRVVVEQT